MDWTNDELNRIGDADELHVAPVEESGSPRRPVPIWVVRDGDDLYVRSFRGGDGRWFRAASASHEGHIQAGGVDKDVTFAEERDAGVNARVDDAYRSKYARYGEAYLDPMVDGPARGTTLKIVPR